MTLTDEQKGWIEGSAKACGYEARWWDVSECYIVKDGIQYRRWQPHIPGPAGAWDREQIRHACGVTHSPRLNNDGTGYLIGVSIYEYKTPEEEALAHVQAGAEVWRARKETTK